MTFSVETLLFHIVRLYNLLCIWFDRFFASHDGPTVSSQLLSDNIVVDTFTRHHGHHQQVRKAVFYAGEGPLYTLDSVFEQSPAPVWLYIGAKLADGSSVDMTEFMHAFLLPGNVIKPKLLEQILADEFNTDSIATFMYLDAKTFEEKEIDSEGLVV